MSVRGTKTGLRAFAEQFAKTFVWASSLVYFGKQENIGFLQNHLAETFLYAGSSLKSCFSNISEGELFIFSL